MCRWGRGVSSTTCSLPAFHHSLVIYRLFIFVHLKSERSGCQRPIYVCTSADGVYSTICIRDGRSKKQSLHKMAIEGR